MGHSGFSYCQTFQFYFILFVRFFRNKMFFLFFLKKCIYFKKLPKCGAAVCYLSLLPGSGEKGAGCPGQPTYLQHSQGNQNRFFFPLSSLLFCLVSSLSIPWTTAFRDGRNNSHCVFVILFRRFLKITKRQIC